MVAVAESKFKFETIWLREYATTYLPSEAGFTYQPEMFRREQVSLVDIRNVFRTGVVAYADKLDGPGAIWVVHGEDGDGGVVVAKIHVVSEALDVTVEKVERVTRGEEETDNAA